MGKNLWKYSYSLTQKLPVLERHLYKYEKIYVQDIPWRIVYDHEKSGEKN